MTQQALPFFFVFHFGTSFPALSSEGEGKPKGFFPIQKGGSLPPVKTAANTLWSLNGVTGLRPPSRRTAPCRMAGRLSPARSLTGGSEDDEQHDADESIDQSRKPWTKEV